jgi:hypothetical protein
VLSLLDFSSALKTIFMAVGMFFAMFIGLAMAVYGSVVVFYCSKASILPQLYHLIFGPIQVSICVGELSKAGLQ